MGVIGIILMSLFSCQVQNLYWLSFALIIDWKVVTCNKRSLDQDSLSVVGRLFSSTPPNKSMETEIMNIRKSSLICQWVYFYDCKSVGFFGIQGIPVSRLFLRGLQLWSKASSPSTTPNSCQQRIQLQAVAWSSYPPHHHPTAHWILLQAHWTPTPSTSTHHFNHNPPHCAPWPSSRHHPPSYSRGHI